MATEEVETKNENDVGDEDDVDLSSMLQIPVKPNQEIIDKLGLSVVGTPKENGANFILLPKGWRSREIILIIDDKNKPRAFVDLDTDRLIEP